MRRDRVDPLTPEQEAELAALLAPERPEPTPAFRARLDAHVEERFEREWERSPAAETPSARRRRRLRLPVLPALATTCAVGVVAIAIAVGQSGGGGERLSSGDSSVASDMAAPSGGAGESGSAAGGGMAQELAPPSASDEDASSTGAAGGSASDEDAGSAGDRAAIPPPVGSAPSSPEPARKVEQSSTLELGAAADRVDDVAQDVLGVVGRHGGIVDRSSVATAAEQGEARFELRFPAARLQAALAQLSRLPDAQVLARTDDTLDVNQAYVSVQRKLTGAEAERRGLLRALANADSEEATERLRTRLDAVERTIAGLERDQRALDRRVDFSRVALTVSAHEPASGDDDGAAFSPGSALDDAGRVLSVTAGVVVLAAAALVPLALLAACAWPLGRALRRRRREQALDATA